MQTRYLAEKKHCIQRHQHREEVREMQIVNNWEELREIDMPKEVALKESDAIHTSHAIIETIRNGLPEEAHTLEACNYVLEKTKEILKTKKLMLK